jgi:electron transfer flavoprotein beta subunit
MNIVVCMKQVPDVEGRVVVEKGTIRIDELVPTRLVNPLDLLAVEEAVRIREQRGSGRVTLVCLGPPEAEESLRKALALGAEDAVLLADAAFDGGDSFATARALATAISTVPHDLVLCGRQADDTQAGQTGAYLAQALGLPLVQDVVRVDVASEGGRLVLHRKLERGDRQVVECSLPVLLTVESGLNAPRNPNIRGVLRARRQRIDRLDAARLGLSPDDVGESGSLIRRTRLTPPKPKMKGLFVPDSKLSSADKLRLLMSGGIARQRQSNMLDGAPDDVARQLVRFFTEQKIIPSEE